MLLAHALVTNQAVQPLYVKTGLAWEDSERAAAERFITTLRGVRPMATISVDMRDVYPATHWAVRGKAPAFDTPDTDVYLEGRNVVLLAKASVYMARIGSSQVMLGSLAHNPFPDASRPFFDAMQRAVSLGLSHPIVVETPFSDKSKADVIRLGESLGVKFELTLSCMQPVNGSHCGRCSKCRERLDAFREAGVRDPASYAMAPPR